MKAVLFLCLIVSIPTFAQVKLPATEAGVVQYQEIVRIGDGKGAARPIFEAIQAWAKQRYPLANEAELHDDPQHGIVFVRSLYSIGDQSIRYTLTVEARVGRYRATITDLVAEQGGLTQPVLPVSTSAEEMSRVAADSVKNSTVIEQAAANQADVYRQLNDACRATLASLKQAMTTQEKE